MRNFITITYKWFFINKLTIHSLTSKQAEIKVKVSAPKKDVKPKASAAAAKGDSKPSAGSAQPKPVKRPASGEYFPDNKGSTNNIIA